MNKFLANIFIVFIFCIQFIYLHSQAIDTILPFPFQDENDNEPDKMLIFSPLYMENPKNIKREIEYNPTYKNYNISTKVGDDILYRRPKAMSFGEYLEYDLDKSIKEYWYTRTKEERRQFQLDLLQGYSYKQDLLEKLLGSRSIGINVQGAVEVLFNVNTRILDNPIIPEENRKTVNPDIDPKIYFNLQGLIGNKFNLNLNFNSESIFNFDNHLNLDFKGEEDDIIKSIDIGNVSLALPTTLISGAYDLFGIKSKLQFGKMFVTTVLSQQRSESQQIQLNRGGIQSEKFRLAANNYDANKHFFLSSYFRDNFENALSSLPFINSNIEIQKIEVWITNSRSQFQSARNIVGFVDLGENSSNIYNPAFTATTTIIPSNETNDLYQQMTTIYSNARNIGSTGQILSAISNFTQSVDYEKIESARLLGESEYKLNAELGFISLRKALLNDEVLAVAYEYILNGKVYRVGEFINDGPKAPDALYLKLIKGINLSPNLPYWDLMMKNIYRISQTGFSADNFILDIIYEDNESGSSVNYLPESDIKGIPLISVLNTDKLNTQLDPVSDGLFDFIEGTTVNSQDGLIILPAVEPFGELLKSKINDTSLDEKYVYKELYSQLKSELLQFSEKNKYYLFGAYRANQSAKSKIALNSFNTPKGSVEVFAGGVRLVEGVDYRVDYTTGDVQIINPSILESGVPIRVKSENNSLFNVKSKTMLASHFDYQFNDNFNLGATVMYLQEKAMYSKANIGEEPFSNFMWGVNGHFQSEVPFLTKFVNTIPTIDTKAKSNFQINGEFAQILPNHNKAIKGRSYLDDFEGTKRYIELRADRPWKLASTPQHQPVLFPEGNLFNKLTYGYNRAKLAWFIIDPYFYDKSTPVDNIKLSDHYSRYVKETEVFPNTDISIGMSAQARVFNLYYDPKIKGPYNFDVEGTAGISSGILPNGELKDPKSRWAGIMRDLTINNFETANVEYIEFWMMDPFIYNVSHSGGNLYINLGNISEDILRDSRKSFENGLKTANNEYSVDSTLWGIVPNTQSVVDGFDNLAIDQQDYGLDGLSTEQERTFFSDYLNRISISPSLGNNSVAYRIALEDPSNDDYQYFRDSEYDGLNDILSRYLKYNNVENNSTTDNTATSFSSSYTNKPDREDINNDNTLSETEAYYQYRVPLHPATMNIGQSFITDIRPADVQLPNGENSTINWYQFRIPITAFENKFGGIADFSSIRFIRLFLKNFEESIVLRFVRLNLIRNDWRTYHYSLEKGSEGTPITTNSSIELSSVSIEENSSRQPVNYVQPPEIERIIDPNATDTRYLNEQALAIQIKNLEVNDTRGFFKYFNNDIRFYERLSLDIHAEAANNETLDDDELILFIRIGSDFINNYYEYEIPLKITPPGFYNNSSNDDRLEVWPELNKIDFDLKLLTDLKLLRNNETNAFFSNKFSRKRGEIAGTGSIHDNDIISVKGNPSLSNIRTIMIGIKNPANGNSSKSAEIWINEMRLIDFKDEDGWAARLHTSTNLADFGTVSFAGNTYTPGFGGISQNITQRANEYYYRYDFTGKFEAGKLFPKKWKIRLPVYYAISEEQINPKYQAVIDEDIKLEDVLARAKNKAEKDSIKRNSQTYTKSKSFNLTNVQIQLSSKKRKIFDPANFVFSYAYNENEYRDPHTSINLTKNYRGTVAYAYTKKPTMISPFKKWKLLKSNKLKLIKDFNLNFIPSQVTFRSEITRYYKELIRKNLSRNADFKITPIYDKNFRWNRFYGFKIPITRSLNVDFSAASFSYIDEPEGIVDKKKDLDAYTIWKDEVLRNIQNGGRLLNYNHQFTVTYKVPINKIPTFNWININSTYSGGYRWIAAPLSKNDSINVGNTILNNRTINVNGRLDFVRFYNKIKYFKRLNQNFRRSGTTKKPKLIKERKSYTKRIKQLKLDKSKTIKHKIGAEKVIVRLFDENNKPIKNFRKETISKNKTKITARKNPLENITVKLTGTSIKKPLSLGKFADTFLQLLMSLRTININFSDIRGSTLSGFIPTPTYFGIADFKNNISPGYAFVSGLQDRNFGRNVAAANLLSTHDLSNDPYLMNARQEVKVRANIKLLKNLRIDLRGNRTYVENFREYFNYDNATNNFLWENQRTTGNLSISYISLKSIFSKIENSTVNTSGYFNQFLQNTKYYSLKLAKKRYGTSYVSEEIQDGYGNGTGYYNGYNQLSQNVLVKAFHKTYGRRENNLLPNIFKILPNWHISYNGLAKIPALKNILNKFSLRHSYRCTYESGNYASNLNYTEDLNGFSNTVDINGNYLPAFEVTSIVMSERFYPLIGIDFSFVNNISAHFSINKQHNLILNFINNQFIETSSNDVVLGSSFRINDVDFFLKVGGKAQRFKNDLNVRADFSLRKNIQLYRNLIEQTNQITAGQRNLTLKVTADWILNDAINIKMFYDRVVNEPYVSLSYPTINSNFGMSVNYKFKSLEKKITF